jgi:hypothetical protein
MNFDQNGNLTPYASIEISLNEFREQFGNSPKRNALLEAFMEYLGKFKEEVSKDFFQLVNGSFVTQKRNPRDIDVVTFLDYQTFEQKETVLSKFRGKSEFKGVDAYIEKVYPIDHPYFIRYQTDLLYWDNLFTKNRAGQKKGYIKLTFGNETSR